MNTLFEDAAQAESPTTNVTTTAQSDHIRDIVVNTDLALESIGQIVTSKWEELSEKNKLNLYILQSKLTEANKQIAAAVSKELADGGSIYPLELIDGNVTESIKDIQKAYEAVKSFVSVEEFLKCCTIKKSDLQSLFSEKKSLTEEKAEQEFKKAMKGNLSSKTGAGKIIVSLKIC